MLEKGKQWAIKINLRKAVIFFIITSFIVTIGFSVVVYSNFQGRISEWEQFWETDRDYGREEKEFDKKYKFDSEDRKHNEDFKERKEKDWENISKRLYLSAGDIVLITGCGIIEIVIGIWYWGLC